MTKSKAKVDYFELLPPKAAKRIYEASDKSVSYRTVLRILKGEAYDASGIIDIALNMLRAEQQKQENRRRKTARLLKKRSTPNKS